MGKFLKIVVLRVSALSCARSLLSSLCFHCSSFFLFASLLFAYDAHAFNPCVGLKTLMDSGQVCSSSNSATQNRLVKEAHEKCLQDYNEDLRQLADSQRPGADCQMPSGDTIHSSNILQRSFGLNLSCLDESHRPGPFVVSDGSCRARPQPGASQSLSAASGGSSSGEGSSEDIGSRRGGPWLATQRVNPSSALTRTGEPQGGGGGLGGGSSSLRNNPNRNIAGGIDWEHLNELQQRGQLRSGGSNSGGSGTVGDDTSILRFVSALSQLDPSRIGGRASLIKAMRDRHDLIREFKISALRSKDAKKTMLEITRMLKAEEELLGGPSGRFIEDMRYKIALMDVELLRKMKAPSDTTFLAALSNRYQVLYRRRQLSTSDLGALGEKFEAVGITLANSIQASGNSPTSGLRRELSALRNNMESRAANNINLVDAIPAYRNNIQTMKSKGPLAGSVGDQVLSQLAAIQNRALTTQTFGRFRNNSQLVERNLTAKQKFDIVKDLERLYEKYMIDQGKAL